MSVQFGRWNFEGQSPAPDYIEKVSGILNHYGPDGNESYEQGGVKILYRAFYTTKESRRETQPHVSPSGAVITWDGRLDNRTELISGLRHTLVFDSTDVTIVAAAHEKWGTGCFAKLIGDWALSIWNPNDRSLTLAKDPIGTHHLYYFIGKDHITWSTILDPLVLFAGKTFTICEEYIAGWFSLFPAAHLTPYVGIHSVPPSSSVLLRPGKHTIRRYWDFDPGKQIRYRADAEYEVHFRAVFAEAVRRRLRSDSPILAELSGGMDSSSIVCMADTVITRGKAECPRLDTITWYDDSMTNWGERRYFTQVEEKRGRTGCHIETSSMEEVGSQSSFPSDFQGDRFAATPVPNSRPVELFRRQAAYMTSHGHRVTLSGIGGGEATGDGVPTPTPELQNLLVQARFFALAHQLKAWAAKMRKPRFPLLWEAVREFVPLVFQTVPECTDPAVSWFHPWFIRRNHAALCGYPCRVRVFGPLPSFQDNLRMLDFDRRLLADWPLEPEMLREVRFPYLDRDFLEFMYAIPREQVVRIGQRRSLMKRALVGIVPDELLNRRKTALVSREPKKDDPTKWPSLAEVGWHTVSGSLRILDTDRFVHALLKARRREQVPIDSLKRTLTLESWLRHLTLRGVLQSSTPTNRSDSFSFVARELDAPTQTKSLAG